MMMSNSRFVALDAKISQLKEVVKTLDTKTLTTYCFWQLFKFGTLGERVNLKSPARQSLYLLGIACSSPEPKVASMNVDGKVEQFEALLNDIFGKYMSVYFPTKEDLKAGLENDWYKAREVAMPMFAGYFFEGKKIAASDYDDLINVYFDGFEEQIKNNFGIDHKQMLKIGEIIGEEIQKNFDRFQGIMKLLKLEQEALKVSTVEEFSEYMASLKERMGPLAKELHELMNGGVSFKLDSIREAVGKDAVDKFIEVFVTERGVSPDIKYITDENPYSYKPVITSDYDEFMLPSLNFFYDAVILNLERFFKTPAVAEGFRKARDNRLEKETFVALKKFFPETARFFESVYENCKSHNEHDLVMFNDRDIIIVEAKASPRREPLRDPAKAYQRIRDDFRRNSGIQSAANQANQLRGLILNSSETPLFDKKGKLLHVIKSGDYDNIYCICITKDDFGMLATDLTLMLEKEADEPYPWVICIQDLKFLLTCLSDIGLNQDYLLGYINQRIKVNGIAIGSDELEFAGAYLNYGGFEFLGNNVNAKVYLDLNESRVFDEIYLEKINGRVYEHQTKVSTYHVLDRDKLLLAVTRDKIKKTDRKSKKKQQRKARRANR